MLEGGFVITEDSVNTVWKTKVLFSDGRDAMAFVKIIPNRDLFVECACAVLGRLLGLRIPEPLIVYPTKEAAEEAGETYGFGSVDIEPRSFIKFTHSNSEDEILFKLEEAGIVLAGGVFDEWIANGDRHYGNIMHSHDEEFWLIDHGTALPDWVNSDFAASRNQLLDNSIAKREMFEKYRFIKEVQKNVLPKYEELAIATLSEKVSGSGYLDDKSIQQMVTFLEERTADVMISLLRTRVGISQLDLKKR